MGDRLTTTEDHMQRLTLYEALREMNRAAADLLDSDVSTEQYRESRLRVRAACQRASDVIAQEQALRLREQKPATCVPCGGSGRVDQPTHGIGVVGGLRGSWPCPDCGGAS